MSAPLLNPSGDQTPHRLATVDLNLTSPLNTGAPNWQTIQYVEDNDFNPDDPQWAESLNYGDGGWGNQDKLGANWHLTLNLNHMIVPGSTPPIYDPTHDYLENASIGKFGRANRVQLRMYDWDVNDVTGIVTPRGRAYTGFASVAWPGYGSGGPNDKRIVACAFMGKGPLSVITHPYPAAGAVPFIGTFSPASLATAGGTPFRITGSGFSTATAVTIAGSAATSYVIWSDSEITGVAPAHAAGAGLPVVVTNPVGASTTGATRATYA